MALLTLRNSTIFYHGSTSRYLTLYYSTMALAHLRDFTLIYTMALLHSSWLYITLPCLCFTLLDLTLFYHGSPLHSTSPHIILPWLYVTLHYSTLALLPSAWLYFTLHYYGSTSFFLTPYDSTMALLHSTWLYMTLHWLYFILLHCT